MKTHLIYRLTTLLVLLLAVKTVPTEGKSTQDFQALVKQYKKSQSQVPKELLRRYDRYLNEHHSSSSKMDAQITANLRNQFAVALKNYEQKFKACDPKGKKIGSTWLDNLTKTFGGSYLKAHEEDIGVIVGYIWQKRIRECERQEEVGLILKEIELRLFLIHRAKTYLKFLSSLSQKEKGKYESSNIVTKQLLTELKHGSAVENLWADERFLRFEARAKNAPKKLQQFFESEGSMKIPFDARGALRLFKKKLDNL